MARFVARRLVGMAAVLFAISVIVFLIFNVIPEQRPGAANGRQERHAGLPARRQHPRGVGLQRVAAPAVPDDDGEDLHRGPGLLLEPAQRRRRDLEGAAGDLLALLRGRAAVDVLRHPLRIPLRGEGGAVADRVLTVAALAGISMPVFLLASIFLVYLTFRVELFPASGYVPLTENPLDWAYHLILPWTTLAVLFVGFYSRVLRANMLETMNEDYVRTARAKGLDERRVRTRHVLRNSLIPIVTLFGLDFAAVIGGGAIITETIFNLGGVGQYAADSISNLDLPPIMAVTLFGAFFVVFFNTVVDIVYAYLDPRIRLGTSAR